MQHKKAIRLTGFVGALCASAALVSVAATNTGAYFTDTKTGAITASNGHIRVSISPSDGQLNFNDLLPGEYQTKTVYYTAHPKGGTEDIWLVFPTGDGSVVNANNPSEAFTGHPEDVNPGPLGQYGHFALSSTGGANFTSYNLANPGTTPGHTGPLCWRNANGWGGSNTQEVYPSGPSIDFCAPSNAILLQSNMSDNDQGSADLTFGFTPKMRSQLAQDAAPSAVVHYDIVATQHGVRPDDPSNG